MAAPLPARSFDLLARFTGRHNVLQLTGMTTSSFSAGGGRIDFPSPMAYSYVACWKRIVIRDGNPCKVILFLSAMVFR
uniref:Uncharacterized protein n=1 Tax=Oryza meridionalis TaxID=40149 RepID=A0A0E0EK38_9ORYZ